MLLPNTQTANNFINLIVVKIKTTNVHIYNICNYYNIYIYVFNTKFDKFNLSYYWKNNTNLNKKNFLTKYFIICWKRIIFKGKGFRVRIFRKNKKITLNFGYSHWTKIKFIYNWDLFKLYRQNYLLFTNSHIDIKFFATLFPTIKPMNRYTLRGLRFKKQVIKRRFGKISQYVSSLH